MNKFQDYDEDDIRHRPGKNKSRPRTKDRPKFENSISGLVVTVDRGRFTVFIKDPKEVFIFAVKARELGRKGVVVGDYVEVVGIDFNNPESMARIVKINDRKNVLLKSVEDFDSTEKILVSNIDAVAIVTATTNPDPNTRFIDRAIISARLANAQIFIIATKSDLKNTKDLSAFYQSLDIPIIETNKTSDLGEIFEILENKTTVFIGPSGVGKSSLVNRLIPQANRRIGEVSEVTGRGKHTSTSAYALEINANTWIIDTPGIRSFGLAHVDTNQIIQGFPELIDASLNCQKNCDHLDSNCEIEKLALENPQLLTRLDSLRRLLNSTDNSFD